MLEFNFDSSIFSVNFSELLNISVPQFPNWWDRNKNNSCLTGLLAMPILFIILLVLIRSFFTCSPHASGSEFIASRTSGKPLSLSWHLYFSLKRRWASWLKKFWSLCSPWQWLPKNLGFLDVTPSHLRVLGVGGSGAYPSFLPSGA